ncbi:Two-component sensor histidine kinase, contains HisKA and HATPase domains [Methylobacterium phyllostachyos]|uniref:histidine kinase n=1 Tax=Methylobacterium phyllostachyos TaxID=582672 RepID=A0A1G9WXU3_9HYPH|nr:HWE histidine kinase domain-containing protein [Methylobacterium phyllostachyos]SDM89259.1 Two-component sensor histidine kinase, contains HisKA and HATPase domains [Methylobacterium phyllostachyos]
MSLTTRILLLVMLALAPAFAIQGYNEYALRSSRDEAVRADTLATARAVADDLSQVAEVARQALDFVARDPAVRAMDPVGCTAYLRDVARDNPQLAIFSLSRPDGAVVCNSLGSAPGSYGVADRLYHRRVLAEDAFVMGSHVRGTVSGKDVLHFARPLRDADGRTVAVLAAALDLAWLDRRLRRDLRHPSTSLTIADADHTVIVRYPDDEELVGTTVPGERMRIVLARGEGVRVAAGFDGRERVLANVQPTGPAAAAWVTVGRDRDVAFADVDAAARRGVMLIGLGAALALAAALLAGRFFIRRPFDRLLRAADAWQTGDLTARIGMTRGDEFGRLGRKLDAMAGTLQRREGELRDEIARGREMQDRQVTMLHELNHRVKNTLATVQALARQSTRGGEASGERLEARILALSKTHDLLTRDDWSGAPLREVLDGEIGPYRDGPDRFHVEGPDVDLPARHTLSFGMTLHELVTNAAKYGALSVAEGRVCIAWRVVVGESGVVRLHLDWVETGGPVTGRPDRKGFGTRLIGVSVERELDGRVEMDFAPAGLRCVIDVPLDAIGGMMRPHSTAARQ